MYSMIHSLVRGIGRFNFQPSSNRKPSRRNIVISRVKKQRPEASKAGNAWGGVSRAFAKAGAHMWHAIETLDTGEKSPSRKIRVIATNKNLAEFLSGISIELMPNKKIRIMTKDKEKITFLKTLLFRRVSDRVICVIQKTGIEVRHEQ